MQENIEPDSDGNYHVGDMILNPGQYQRAFGDPSSQIPILDSGIDDERFRWKDGGKFILFLQFKLRKIFSFSFSKSFTLQVPNKKYKFRQ